MLSEQYLALYASALSFFLKSEIDNPKGRKGGYFTVVSASTGETECDVLCVGQPEPSLPLADFAREKARRLFQNAEHISGFQSRNPDAGQWGGAVRANEQMIFSMSGMPEFVDEAINLCVAMKLQAITESRLLDIIAVSKNPYLNLIRTFASATNR